MANENGCAKGDEGHDEESLCNHPSTVGEAKASASALSGAHSSAIIQHGTWILVAGEMLNSIMAHLPPKMRADIADTFRNRIERLLALGDDNALPSAFTSELMKEVNKYLKVLEAQ